MSNVVKRAAPPPTRPRSVQRGNQRNGVVESRKLKFSNDFTFLESLEKSFGASTSRSLLLRHHHMFCGSPAGQQEVKTEQQNPQCHQTSPSPPPAPPSGRCCRSPSTETSQRTHSHDPSCITMNTLHVYR